MAKDEVSIHILRKVVIDGFILAGLGVSLTLVNVFWEPFQRGFFCGDESLMFPFKNDTVTVPMLRAVGIVLPFIIVLFCEWLLLRKERADNDIRVFGIRLPAWVRGFYCVCVSFGIGLCFSELATEIAKNTIGRNRPHFFAVCQPSVNCSSTEWQGRYIESHEYRCNGPLEHLFGNMRKSFLSGHSSWAAFSMIYTALYLEKRMIWRGSRTLRHLLQFGLLMLSWYTALSRVSDYRHHWSDVLAGYALGTAIAVLMFLGTDFVKRRKDHVTIPQFEVNLQNQASCCSRI